MVPVLSTLFCVVTLFVCLILPVLVLIFFARKNRGQGIVSAWLLGAAGFFVTQILIRLPILTVLQNQPWFLTFAQSNLFAYAFTLAFTAGLFELAGRFVVAKLLQKNLTFRRSLAAGLGHGGIEAILLVGMTYINNLIYIAMVNTGTFDVLFTQLDGNAAAIAQLEQIRFQLVNTPSTMFLLGGFERLLAMTAHAAMSVLVCYGVAHKKVLPCTLLCLAIHTFIDLTAGISLLSGNVLSQGAVYIIIYLILIVVAVFSVFILNTIRRHWNETEVSHDSEK